MIVCRKFSREFRDPPQPIPERSSPTRSLSLKREGANTSSVGIISILKSKNPLPKQGGLGWVSSWWVSFPKRVPALYTKAMWHPCTLELKKLV